MGFTATRGVSVQIWCSDGTISDLVQTRKRWSSKQQVRRYNPFSDHSELLAKVFGSKLEEIRTFVETQDEVYSFDKAKFVCELQRQKIQTTPFTPIKGTLKRKREDSDPKIDSKKPKLKTSDDENQEEEDQELTETKTEENEDEMEVKRKYECNTM